MSTNHTETYNLSQWEKSDKVLMEDFNADNAIIDATLKRIFSEIDSIRYILEEKGNAMPYTYNYTGRGNQNVALPFNHRPAIVFVFPEDGSLPVVIGFYGVAATNTPDVTFHSWPTKGGMTSFTGATYNQKDKKYIAIGILDCIW